jgi:hypothetical protein
MGVRFHLFDLGISIAAASNHYSMHNQRTPSIHDARYRAAIDILVETRKQCNVSQTTLAERVGFTQPDVSKIERYERRLDIMEFLDFLHAITGSDSSLMEHVWKRIYECHD